MNLRRFNKDTHNIQHQGQDNAVSAQVGNEGIESQSAEKEVVVNQRLDLSQHHVLSAQKATNILGCFKSSMTSKSREVILPP